MGIFAKRKKPATTPKPIPVYTQGDDILVRITQGEETTEKYGVAHIFSRTEGIDTRTQDNVVRGPVAKMSVQQIKEAIARFHEKND